MNLSDMTDDERREMLKRALGLDALPNNPNVQLIECSYCHNKFEAGSICPTCWNAMLDDLNVEENE